MARRQRESLNFHEWRRNHGAIKYHCGWCDSIVASSWGGDFVAPNGQPISWLRLCPNCKHPTFIDDNEGVFPGSPFGDTINHLPPELDQLYTEARTCVSSGANHAAVMVGRKILMHVAVTQGAPTGERFVAYVDYLVANNLVPPNTKDWVDEIRQVGNDANHEIFDINPNEAKATIEFVAMLLRLLYEYPAKGAQSVAMRAKKDADS